MVETKKIVASRGQLEQNVLWRYIVSDICNPRENQRGGDEESEAEHVPSFRYIGLAKAVFRATTANLIFSNCFPLNPVRFSRRSLV